MLHTPLIETLRLFGKEEIKRLEKFVCSPINYYQDNPSGVISLFNELKSQAPDFKNKAALNKEYIAQKINTEDIDRVITGLHWVVRKYIGWAYSDESYDDFYKKLGMLNFYLEKKEFQKFETQFKKIERGLSSSIGKFDADAFYKLFIIHSKKSDLMQKFLPDADLNLGKTLDFLSVFYLTQKAQIIYSLFLRSKNTKLEFEGYQDFINEVNLFLTTYPEEVPDSLRFYYQAILILLKREEVNIDLFQDLLSKNKSNLSREDYITLSSLIRQVFLDRIRDGEIELTAKVFDMYQQHLREELILIDDLTPSTFGNIVRYGCRCDQLDWVAQFLEDCKPRFFYENDFNLFELYTAYFQLHKGDFQAAKKNLSFDFKDALRRVDARCIELMVLFMCQDENIENKINTFIKRLHNTQDLPLNSKNGFNQFADVLKKLTKLHPDHQLDPNLKQDQKQYHDKIDKVIESVNGKTCEAWWLIKQLQSLKKEV